MLFGRKSRCVTDFIPLSGSPPLPSAPFGRDELAAPPPLSTSHTASVHGTFSASRGANLPIPHSYMIDNIKPLSGADYYFFHKCLCRPPRVMKKGRPGQLPCQKPPLVAFNNIWLALHYNIIWIRPKQFMTFCSTI